MLKIKLAFLTVLTILFSLNTFSQSAKDQLALANSVELVSENFLETLDFELKAGYVIIPVKIGEKTYRYILDTGGFNTANSKIMSEHHLPNLMEVKVGSANKIKKKIKVSKIPNLQIANIKFQKVGVFNFDFEDAPMLNCYTNGGLIGKSLIKECIWQFDLQAGKITLTDDIKKLSNLENSEKLKVKFNKIYDPFITVKINGNKEQFLLDFGFDGFVALTEATGKKYANDKRIESIGEGGYGVNGSVQESIFIIPLKTVELDNLTFDNVTTHYTKSSNYNLIGSEILKMFIVTLNFPKKELYLTPYDAYQSQLLKDNFGFNLRRDTKTNKVYVSSLFKDFSDEDININLNDEVLSINGTHLQKLSYCESFFFIYETLKSNKTLEIILKQEGKERVLKLGRKLLFD